MKLTDAPASVAEADDPGQPKYATLPRRPSVRVITALWAATVLAAIAGAALSLVAAGTLVRGDLAWALMLSVSIAAYATLGALIVRRPATSSPLTSVLPAPEPTPAHRREA